jgi:hypothetical protein
LKQKSCLAENKTGKPAQPTLAWLGRLGMLLQLLLALSQFRILK